ncbi:DUF4810 domain-containing protein [Hydrogenophaga sp.]|uniref:DUF4810 domain-containing protein n=1 Tax=Hydrogenophaga sp. TaxID=1904254 RepID=UPI0027291736|nr:DUF4810 domain-containing protein [Hydrogenophaga sp.]MDO9434830.1 DUF4810 domain-containing protein [Hydrogenophaga sp.]
MTTTTTRALAAALLGTSLLLGGCVAAPKPLYQWGSYPAQVHKHFKGESPQAQIDALEVLLADNQGNAAATPPGLHAHLGLLYSKVGRDDKMEEQFELEKATFPESAPYMNRLLAQLKK